MKILLTILFSVLLLIPVFTVQGQEVKMEIPDFESIQKNIRDHNSTYYYPYLMKRYMNNDTTLSINELRHLYLGYSYQESYNPYRISKHSENIADLYSKYNHTDAECDSIIKYAVLSLDDFPFDLRQINLMAYAYKQKGETEQAAIWEKKLRQILRAIRSTGNGESPETAFYVIYSTHEYDLVNRMGLKADKYVFVEPMYDYIEVAKNDQKIEGFYFNVSRILSEYDRKYKDD